MRKVHRYDDCPDICTGDGVHVYDNDSRQVTCDQCREDMGLPPLDEVSD